MRVIIYSGEHGRCMVYGDVDCEELPMPGDKVRIKNARMILRVEKVGNLGIASVGPKEDTDTRITAPVPTVTDTVTQAAECTPEAAEAIDAWPNWQ